MERQNKPEMNGLLLTDEKDPNERKIVGKIALWRNHSKNENAPVFRGVVQTDKGTHRVSLWKFRAREEGL